MVSGGLTARNAGRLWRSWTVTVCIRLSPGPQFSTLDQVITSVKQVDPLGRASLGISWKQVRLCRRTKPLLRVGEVAPQHVASFTMYHFLSLSPPHISGVTHRFLMPPGCCTQRKDRASYQPLPRATVGAPESCIRRAYVESSSRDRHQINGVVPDLATSRNRGCSVRLSWADFL